MILDTRWLTDTATLWVKTGRNSFGHDTYATPVTINVRWEEGVNLFEVTEGNVSRPAKATVYLNQSVNVGDYLYLGASASSTPVKGSYEITQYTRINGVVGSKDLKQVLLG